MRKIFVLILMLCMVSMTFACNSSQSIDKKVPQYGIQTEDAFKKWKNVTSKTEEHEDPENVYEIEQQSDFAKDVNSLGTEIVSYINATYSMNWVYEDVVIKIYDFSGTDFEFYNAYYSTNDYILYLNSNYKCESSGFDYIIAHELIHYIRHLNIGTANFQYEDTKGLGNYMMEALTDLLTIEMYGNTEKVDTFFMNNSGYCYQIVSMKVLKLAIPKLMYYYLENDMKSLENEFNLLASKYVDFEGTDVENPFINYLDVLDACYGSYIAMCNAYTYNDLLYAIKYAELNNKYIIGQYELSVMLLMESDKSTKKQALSYIENLYRLESEVAGDNSDEFYSEYLEYLNSCMEL